MEVSGLDPSIKWYTITPCRLWSMMVATLGVTPVDFGTLNLPLCSPNDEAQAFHEFAQAFKDEMVTTGELLNSYYIYCVCRTNGFSS
jgi:hypothetical protein